MADQDQDEGRGSEPEPEVGRRLQQKRDRLARLLKVMTILEASAPLGLTAEQVGKITSTAKRTAYRDIKAIGSELGYPTIEKGGRYTLAPGSFLPALRLTLAQATSVFIAARLATRFADTYDPSLYSAFLALQRTLPKALGKHVVPVLAEFARRPVNATLNDHFEKLAQAWAEKRIVSFTYVPAGYDGDHGPTQRPPGRRRVHPYLLEPSMQTHSLYLIGHDEERGAVRTFKLERILDLSVTPQRFEPPNADMLARSLRLAWDIISNQAPVDVELRFVPSVAARVAETVWHPSQTSQPQADGSLLWRATVSGTTEIRLWILGWGDEVEVLAPEDLRADVVQTHARAAKLYRP
jgi:proteasome accessory factor B